MFLRICAAVIVLFALGACAGGGRTDAIVSDATEPGAGRYDAARAEQLVQQAREAAGDGDLAAAETAFEQALDAWPTSKPAWEGLAEVYDMQERQEDVEVARFFAVRMDWVSEVPPLIASGAFENVVEGRVPVAENNAELRRRSVALVEFLRTRDTQTRDSTYDVEQRYWEFIPAAMLTGLAAFVVGGVILGF